MTFGGINAHGRSGRRWFKGSPRTGSSNGWSVAGVNPVNAVVDITNLVMLEQGQPLHAFDSDALERSRANPSTPGVFPSATPVTERSSSDSMAQARPRRCVQVVTCHDMPVAIAGVMGSLASGVTDTTKQHLAGIRHVHAQPVRRSARPPGLRTDASTRYEKGLPGISPCWPPVGPGV